MFIENYHLKEDYYQVTYTFSTKLIAFFYYFISSPGTHGKWGRSKVDDGGLRIWGRRNGRKSRCGWESDKADDNLHDWPFGLKNSFAFRLITSKTETT